MKRLSLVLLLVAGLLAALPASGMAAETFGSRFKNMSNSDGCDTPPDTPAKCTLISYIHPSDPDGDPYSGGAPRDGVITRYKIQAANGGQVTFRVADLSIINPENATARNAATGQTVAVVGGETVEEFPARLSIKKGQHLGIDTTGVQAVYASSGSKFTFGFKNGLQNGAGQTVSTHVTEELNVGGVIEPDADKDGFGDESQDACPTNPAKQAGPCTGGPSDAPRVAGISVSGGKLGFRLSEAARVKVTVERKTTGRKVRGKCKAQTKKNRGAKKCKRFKKVKTLNVRGTAGVNKASLRLKKGTYRITMVATDAAGNKSGKTVKTLKVKK